MSGREAVERWLTYLACDLIVADSTQNTALQSVCFLYRHVCGRPLENVNAIRAKKSQRIIEVPEREDVAALINAQKGPNRLITLLMYASGMRVSDVVRLRVKDLYFNRQQIHLHRGKGRKDRRVQFPKCLHDAVCRQVESVRLLWREDCERGSNGVSLTAGYSRKHKSAHHDFKWYYLFPSDNETRCPDTGVLYRHHRNRSSVSRQIKKDAEIAGIDKRMTSHILRHAWAVHSLENGVDIRTIQELAGHSDIRTTAAYLHAKKDGVTAAPSPLASLLEKPIRPEKPRLRVVS